MKTTIGDFTSSLSLGSEIKETSIRKNYRLPNIKKSKVEYAAESVVVPFTKEGRTAFDVEFRVSNNDVAFRYTVYPKKDIFVLCDTAGNYGGLSCRKVRLLSYVHKADRWVVSPELLPAMKLHIQ